MSTELGTTGQAIWEVYGAAKLDAGSQALVRELARCADVLDRLDDLAMGRRQAWVELVFDDMGEIHLSVDKILSERRTHWLAFKALYAEVRAAKIEADSKIKDEGPVDMLAELRKLKGQRERQSG